jgi:3D (Asp-Asp-Asp) domain-containing protein
VVQSGAYGITARRVRVRMEDGIEVGRQVEGEWVALQPQPHIIGYGTKIVMHTQSTPDGTIKYYRALQFWVTSYSPSAAGGNTTASGKPVRKGLVGVDPNYIPFGTMMYVPGYGYAEAADTGHISGRWLDLGYSDSDYVAWHQWVTVYFLWPPPAFVPWTIPPPSHY